MGKPKISTLLRQTSSLRKKYSPTMSFVWITLQFACASMWSHIPVILRVKHRTEQERTESVSSLSYHDWDTSRTTRFLWMESEMNEWRAGLSSSNRTADNLSLDLCTHISMSRSDSDLLKQVKWCFNLQNPKLKLWDRLGSGGIALLRYRQTPSTTLLTMSTSVSNSDVNLLVLNSRRLPEDVYQNLARSVSMIRLEL